MRLALLTSLLIAAATPVAADQTTPVQLAFAAEGVTVVARDVLVRDLLDEWSRAGKTVIDYSDAIGDRRVSLSLTMADEIEVLKAIVGPSFGVLAAMKRQAPPLVSRLARVRITPTTEVDIAAVPAPTPERTYSYYIPDIPTSLMGEGPSIDIEIIGPPPVPERMFEYAIPEHQPVDADGPLGPMLQAPLPPAVFNPIPPERRFQYFVPYASRGVLPLIAQQ